VVGFSHNEQDNGGKFTTDAIKFNPSTITPSNYAGVPVYTSTDYENLVSSPNYHNATNLLAGKGDPCKLAGLSIAQIKTKLAGNEVPDSGWRLPTSRENRYLVGGDNLLTTDVGNETFSNDKHPYLTTSPWSGGRFPITSWGTGTDGGPVNTSGAFIPNAGQRSDTGAVSYPTSGLYWSSTPASNLAGYGLYITSSEVQPSRNSGAYAYGRATRCVKP
jgi:hypothetical protein